MLCGILDHLGCAVKKGWGAVAQELWASAGKNVGSWIKKRGLLGRVHEGKHVRSWDLSHCMKEIWEWDWGSTGSQNVG